MPRKISIFYSWQSEMDPRSHRELIERALNSAAQHLTNTDGNVEAAVDRDAAGVGGAPDIAAVILAKIDNADIFVADVTLVPNGPDRRPTPNANVLVETGYAWHEHGWPQILLVQNMDSGTPEQLPFDLRKHRVVTYSTKGQDLNAVMARLTVEFQEALKLILASIRPKALDPPELSALQESVEQVRGDRQARATAFSKWFVRQVVEIAPDLNVPPKQAAVALDAVLPSTIPLVQVFGRAADLVATYGDAAATRGLYEGLADLVDRMVPQKDGGFYDHIGELYAFIGHEVLSMLVGKLLTYQKYEVLEQLLSRPMRPGKTSRLNVPYLPEVLSTKCTLLDETLNTGNPGRLSIRADRLKSRHEAEPLVSLCDAPTLAKGDFLLFIKSSIRANGYGTRIWWPWLSVWSALLDSFSNLFRSKEHLAGLQRVIGILNTAEFIAGLRSNSLKMFNLIWRHYGQWPINLSADSEFGSEP
jgi:hypothetical protein